MNPFNQAKHQAHENLYRLRSILNACTDEGMVDTGANFYNQIVSLLEEVEASETKEELNELIVQAKILEQDFVAWLSLHGRTSVSLEWPKV